MLPTNPINITGGWPWKTPTLYSLPTLLLQQRLVVRGGIFIMMRLQPGIGLTPGIDLEPEELVKVQG